MAKYIYICVEDYYAKNNNCHLGSYSNNTACAASDSFIYIRPGTLENQTEGFVLIYPLENTIEQGQTITFKNEDLHRRPFTLVSEENLFPPTILTFRRSLSLQFDEPGTYNFYLEEKPTVTVQFMRDRLRHTIDNYITGHHNFSTRGGDAAWQKGYNNQKDQI